jgi:tetratricopeptide (TPR) repeat protein
MMDILEELKPLLRQWMTWRKYAIPALLALVIWSMAPTTLGQVHENLAMLELALRRTDSDLYSISLALSESAFEHFDTATAYMPQSERYWRNLAFARMVTGNQTEAIAAWQKVTDATTELRYWSDLAWHGCRCESSLPWLQVAVEVAPPQEQVETRYQLGLMYRNNQMWDEARQVLEPLLSTEPKRADIFLTVASIYFHGYRDRDAAVRLLNQALALPATSGDTSHMVGVLLMDMAEYADAEVALRQAYRTNPSRYTVIDLGRSLFYQQKFMEALAIFEEANSFSSRDRQDSTTHFWLGRTYMQLERFSEAIRELKMAITIFPENLSTYMLLGDAYVAIGDYDNASDTYRAILARSPGNAEATQRLEGLPK